MQTFYKICLILMIVGGINWGLVGLFQFDFVGWLLGGSASIWSRIVFTLVGIAALCGIPGLFSDETDEVTLLKSMPTALPAPPERGSFIVPWSSRSKKALPFGRAGASAPERVNDRCFCWFESMAASVKIIPAYQIRQGERFVGAVGGVHAAGPRPWCAPPRG